MSVSDPRTLPELVDHVLTHLPHHTFLVRSSDDGEQGQFFANIARRDWRTFSPPQQAMSYGWGSSPELALELAIEGAVHLPGERAN